MLAADITHSGRSPWPAPKETMHPVGGCSSYHARRPQHGFITFPGSKRKNKNPKAWEVPLTAESRPVIDKLAVEYLLRGPRGADDPGYLFPHPYELTAPLSVDIASELHDLAERAAHVPHLDGGCWHPYRRKHDTELAHHNPAVAAATTGRRDVSTMLERYVKVSRGAVCEALSHRRPLREDAE